MKYLAFSIELLFQLCFLLLIIRYGYLVRKGDVEITEKYRSGFLISSFLLPVLSIVTAIVFFGQFQVQNASYLWLMTGAICYFALFLSFDILQNRKVKQEKEQKEQSLLEELRRNTTRIVLLGTSAFSLLVFAAVSSMAF